MSAKKGVDPLNSQDLEWHLRQARHTHNGFFGRVAMARTNMRIIAEASTTTAETAELAWQVYKLLEQLTASLGTRMENGQPVVFRPGDPNNKLPRNKRPLED